MLHKHYKFVELVSQSLYPSLIEDITSFCLLASMQAIISLLVCSFMLLLLICCDSEMIGMFFPFSNYVDPPLPPIGWGSTYCFTAVSVRVGFTPNTKGPPAQIFLCCLC